MFVEAIGADERVQYSDNCGGRQSCSVMWSMRQSLVIVLIERVLAVRMLSSASLSFKRSMAEPSQTGPVWSTSLLTRHLISSSTGFDVIMTLALS